MWWTLVKRFMFRSKMVKPQADNEYVIVFRNELRTPCKVKFI